MAWGLTLLTRWNCFGHKRKPNVPEQTYIDSDRFTLNSTAPVAMSIRAPRIAHMPPRPSAPPPLPPTQPIRPNLRASSHTPSFQYHHNFTQAPNPPMPRRPGRRTPVYSSAHRAPQPRIRNHLPRGRRRPHEAYVLPPHSMRGHRSRRPRPSIDSVSWSMPCAQFLPQNHKLVLDKTRDRVHIVPKRSASPLNGCVRGRSMREKGFMDAGGDDRASIAPSDSLTVRWARREVEEALKGRFDGGAWCTEYGSQR